MILHIEAFATAAQRGHRERQGTISNLEFEIAGI
jgi:hypothetical protein